MNCGLANEAQRVFFFNKEKLLRFFFTAPTGGALLRFFVDTLSHAKHGDKFTVGYTIWKFPRSELFKTAILW